MSLPPNRDAPALLPTPPSKRISLPASQRLSQIVEKPVEQPPPPQTPGDAAESSRPASKNAHIMNMPFSRRHNIGKPPSMSEEKKPPSYTAPPSDLGAAGADPFKPDEYPQPWYDKLRYRRSWRWAAFAVLALVIAAIALGVGLGVGLSQRNNNSTANSSGAPSAPSSTPTTLSGPFPVGIWQINSFLTNTSSACVSNAAAWNCPPYTLYSSSALSSQTTFSWIINSTTSPASNGSLTLSSTYNPLSSISIPATSLTLVDQGLSTERYTFNINLPRKVFPQTSITSDGSAVLCYFNSTVFSASLFTRTASFRNTTTVSGSTFGSTSRPSGAASGGQWPGAVQITQTSPGVADVADCYPASGSTVSGPRISSNPSGLGQGTSCLCEYES